MQKNVTLAVILFFALLVSLYLGTTVASGDIIALSGWAGVTVLILFLIKGYRFSWMAMLFLAWGQISFMLSFRIEPTHAISVVFGLFVLSSKIRGVKLPLDVSQRQIGILPLNIAILVFLFYGGIHLTISRALPVLPGEFNLGNSAKAYFKTYAPLAFLLFGLNAKIGFHTQKNWAAIFIYLMTLAVLGNLAYLGYLYINGFSSVDNRAGASEIGLIYIPLINAVPHHFAMRTLGPLAVLFGFGLASAPGWLRQQPLLLKLALIFLICGGLAGAVMSGGRAAVGMCLLFFGLVAIYRKRVGLLIAFGMASLLVLAVVNLFSGFINEKAPTFVARPLQYFMLKKGDSMDTINHSQDQRNALYDAAIDEWKSDPRITIIGRGTYSYKNTYDELRSVLGEQGAFVEINLRAGTCHALIPSALLQYGVFGFFLYLIIWFFLLRYNWKLFKFAKREGLSFQIQTMIMCLFFYLCLRLIIDLVAAAWMTMFVVTMFLLIRSRISYELSQRLANQEAENTAPLLPQLGSRVAAPATRNSFKTL